VPIILRDYKDALNDNKFFRLIGECYFHSKIEGATLGGRVRRTFGRKLQPSLSVRLKRKMLMEDSRRSNTVP